MNRREAKAIGNLTSKAVTAASNKIDSMHEQQLTEAREGDGSLVRTQRASADKMRRQGEGFLADAAEAEAKGKTSKAARHRKVGERALRQADGWDAKADVESARLRAWAAEEDAK